MELIKAAQGFCLVATMNPGGDFGKKEVSRKRIMNVCFQQNIGPRYLCPKFYQMIADT